MSVRCFAYDLNKAEPPLDLILPLQTENLLLLKNLHSLNGYYLWIDVVCHLRKSLYDKWLKILLAERVVDALKQKPQISQRWIYRFLC